MKKLIFIFIFFLFFNSISNAQIAIFPFENLKSDINGIDLKISQKVADKLDEMGFEVITPYEIVNFLEGIKTPFIGWIDSVTSKKIGKKFNCSLILLGTILEFDKSAPAFSLNIRLLAINNYKLIWGKTITVSKAEEISLLNLKKKKWNEMENAAISKIIENIPGEIAFKAATLPEMEIEHVSITPKYSRGNGKITCYVKMKFYKSIPTNIKFIVNNKEEIKGMLNKTNLSSTWRSPEKEGRYSVSLLATWDGLTTFRKRIFLTTFYVDNTKPDLLLKLKRGTYIAGKLFFSRFIKIVPLIKNRDFISHWKMKIIYDKEKTPVTTLERYGQLPKHFVWKGVTNRGGAIPNGKYNIILKVWDRAENFSEKQKSVYVVKSLPPVSVTGEYNKKNLKIYFRFSEKHFVKISSWRFEIFDNIGNLIAYKNGKKLPDFLSFSKKIFKKNLIFSLEVKDILGNKLSYKKRKLPLKTLKKEKNRKKKKTWLNEF